MIETPGIDLLTPYYHGKRFLKEYLIAISALNYPKDKLRVHIVNNSPSEALEIDHSSMPFSIFTYQSKENLGFSGGNNFLFDKLIDNDFPYFFLLNQDSKIHPDCLSQLALKMSNYPDTGFLEAKQSPREHPKVYEPETFETSWCSGGGLLIRKAALKDTGGFDHKFFMYCEDVDLSWRMWQAGWKCRICPEAVYVHITEDLDVEKDQSGRYFFSFRNGFLMNLKYNSFKGILEYYVKAFLVCFKQDPIRRKAFLKAYFAAQKYMPYYVFKRLFSKQKKSKWIYLNNFDFGERREFVDTPEGREFI